MGEGAAAVTVVHNMGMGILLPIANWRER